ncbi:MAG: type II toxin-antitoxin system RelE/ParE family toxin [Brevundimonas sp.]
MFPVVWAREALDDASRIADYISDDNPAAADRTSSIIFDSAEVLGQYPFMYRSGRRDGTREAIVHPNYILVYGIEATQVRIVNVLHTARRCPPE